MDILGAHIDGAIILAALATIGGLIVAFVKAYNHTTEAEAGDTEADTKMKNAVTEMALRDSAYIKSLVEQINTHQTDIVKLNRALGKVEGELAQAGTVNVALVADVAESQRTIKELREIISQMTDRIDFLEKALAISQAAEGPPVS